MEEYLRIAVLGIVVIPMAISDLRERMVVNDILCIATAIGGVFFAYDVLTGRFAAWSSAEQIGVIMALLIGCIIIFMAKVFKTMGITDGILVFVMTMIVPAISGVPVAIFATFAGYAAAAIYSMSANLTMNMSDVLHRRPFCADMICRHIKRRQEKFTIAGTPKIGGVTNDSIVDEDGEDYFVGEEKEGMPVTIAMPLVTFYLIGYLLVIGFLFFTDFDSSHLARIIEDPSQYMADPRISINVGF